MKQKDVEYLCTTIGNLAGIPIRIYRNGKKTYFHSILDFPKDPLSPFEEKVLSISDHIGYFITPRFHYYGIVNSKDYKIVLGPSKQSNVSEKELKELAFECEVSPDDTDVFLRSMNGLVPFPLDSILQILSTLNFVLNHERLSLSDMTIYDEEQDKLSKEISSKETERNYEQKENAYAEMSRSHNSFSSEQRILSFVRHGDLAALKEWIRNAPAVRPGTLSFDAIRQSKNTFIVTATLVSRSAIRGGMNVDEALSLSDSYIQKCDLLSNFSSIENLQYHMVFDYTERVEKLHIGKSPSKFLIDIGNYVQKHLTEPVDVEALAKAMFLSRTYLAIKFKKETGMTLTDFILKEKIEEGKRLLRYTDKPIALIASYLGFSSQSHFANTFKKYVKESPKEYRMKHEQ